MKLRTGRKNPHTLYLQLGDEPSNEDVCLGLIIVPAASHVIVDCVNRHGSADLLTPAHTGPERVSNALEVSDGRD